MLQCVSSDCDDVDIMNVNLSGDIVAEEERINKEVQCVPPW